MATIRSPHYPSMSLGEAVAAVRPVLKAEGRQKMARVVLAGHLGYKGLSGRALTKLGALRAYGLIEGQGDETRVSQDALICIEAPEGSPDRIEALQRCAARPTIFKEISAEFSTAPSESNLRYWLIKKGFTSDAAKTIVQTYLATIRLVGDSPNSYNPDPIEERESEMEAAAVADPPLAPTRAPSERMTGFAPATEGNEIKVMLDGEWLRVSAVVDVKGAKRLMKALRANIALLEDDDDEDSLA